MTQEDGSTTQVVEAVAEWDGRERTVSFVRTDEGMDVLVEAYEDELGDLELTVDAPDGA
jgi:hypothetical protein